MIPFKNVWYTFQKINKHVTATHVTLYRMIYDIAATKASTFLIK